MHCFIEKEKFPAFRESLMPNISDPEEKHMAIWDAGLARFECRDGLLRVRTVFGQTEVPARVERPGVIFVELERFLFSSENPGYLPEPEDEVEINATRDRVDTSYLPLGLGEGEYALFPDPATAPETWVYTPEPEDSDLTEAE